MHSQTLTLHTVIYGPNGNARRASVSLPYVSILASDPRYAAPPPPPEPEQRLPFEKPPRWTEKLIRRTLGKDREQSAKLRNQIGYEAAVRRIERGGA